MRTINSLILSFPEYLQMKYSSMLIFFNYFKNYVVLLRNKTGCWLMSQFRYLMVRCFSHVYAVWCRSTEVIQRVINYCIRVLWYVKDWCKETSAMGRRAPLITNGSLTCNIWSGRLPSEAGPAVGARRSYLIAALQFCLLANETSDAHMRLLLGILSQQPSVDWFWGHWKNNKLNK